MTCNCNEVKTIILNNLCDCNNCSGSGEGEVGKKKYLDKEGTVFLMQLLKVAFEESPSLIDRVTSDGNSITLHYKDGSKQEIVLEGIKDALNQIKGLKDSPASLLNGLTAAEMVKFCKLIIQLGGGLAIDDNGKIFVDFDSMPTDKFENLMKQIKVPIWVTGHAAPTVTSNPDGTYTIKSGGYGDWYVDGDHPAASDTDFDSTPMMALRGQTKDLPFKTIQACINYVTNNFNITEHTVNINVDAGTYKENLSVGQYSRTTGSLKLTTYDQNPVTIASPSPSSITLLKLSFSPLTVDNFNFNGVYTGVGATAHIYPYYVYITNGGVLNVSNCIFDFVENLKDGEDASKYHIRGFQVVYSGQLVFQPSASRSNTIKATQNRAGSFDVIVLETNAILRFNADQIAQSHGEIVFNTKAHRLITDNGSDGFIWANPVYSPIFTGTHTPIDDDDDYWITVNSGGRLNEFKNAISHMSNSASATYFVSEGTFSYIS